MLENCDRLMVEVTLLISGEMKMFQRIGILCGVFLSIAGLIKGFKSINWMIKLGLVFILVAEIPFIINFIRGLFQGIIG